MTLLKSLPERTEEAEGFHGTSQASAQQMQGEAKDYKFQLPPHSLDNRYGRGVYFWRNSKETAVWWAKYRNPGSHIVIFRAKVRLGKHLDLLTKEGQNIVKMVAEVLTQRMTAKNPNFKCTEAAVLNWLAGMGWLETAQILDLGRNHAKLEPIFPDSFSLEGPRLIVCAYRLENILEVTNILEQAA